MTCTNGHTNSEGAKFCSECGVEILAASAEPATQWSCTNGHENLSSNLFCTICGSKSSNTTTLESDVMLNGDQQKSVTKDSVIGIVLSVVLGAVGGVFGVILGRRSMKKINDSQGTLSGLGAAITSIVLGAVSILLTLILVIALTISSNSAHRHQQLIIQQQNQERAANNAAIEQRKILVGEVEASIKKLAKDDFNSGTIDGNAVYSASCSAVSGSYSVLTTLTNTFQCFVVTIHNNDGTDNGYYYNATVNWDTGEYTYGLGKP